MTLTELINNFNTKYSTLGKFELYTWNRFVQTQEVNEDALREEQGIQCDVSDSDLVLVYDFNDDCLSPTDTEAFAKDYYTFWDEVKKFSLPEIHEFDGSGGGLYYGMTIYHTK